MLPLCCLLAISCLLHCSVFKVQSPTFFKVRLKCSDYCPNTSIQSRGGGYRIRTGDPLLAKQVLYQLSYWPVVDTSSISLPSAFGESSLTPSRLLSKSKPLRWVSIWCGASRRFLPKPSTLPFRGDSLVLTRIMQASDSVHCSIVLPIL